MIIKPKDDEKLKIVVTDSGLGGLSVAAELESNLRNINYPYSIEIIFFNSLAASDFGYNSMPTSEKKAEVFNSALNAIEQLFNPDLILIACNTLSVVYEDTEFAKETKINVLGIIDLGVEDILENLNSNSRQTILLLGTPTTIYSFAYQRRLIRAGVNENVILGQACPMLETEIQQDPNSDKVKSMIAEFLGEAQCKNVDESDSVVAVLCCTHYGYSERLFADMIDEKFHKDFVIINSNKKMVDFIIRGIREHGDKAPIVTVKVLSQVELREKDINSISEIIEEYSVITASALRNYRYNNSLFEFSR